MNPKTLKITPCLNNLLIEINELPSADLVRVPEGARRYPYGEVLAVGQTCKFIAVGDKVLFRAENVLQFNHPEGDYFILSEDAVLAKYEFDVPNN